MVPMRAKRVGNYKGMPRWTHCSNGHPYSEYRIEFPSGQSGCKLCRSLLNHARAPHIHVLSKYGLTTDSWYQMFEEQSGKCKICSTPFKPNLNGRRNSACVDHNHITGKVRGLLCNTCNVGLGQFKDDIANLVLAINYLVEND